MFRIRTSPCLYPATIILVRDKKPFNDQAVCLGGLFHSICGTRWYKTVSASLDDRPIIRRVIGERAERLAFLFCVAHRWEFFEELGKKVPMIWNRISEERMPVTQNDLRYLIEMEMANYVEFMPRVDFTIYELDELQEDRVERGRDVMSYGAYVAITEAMAPKRRSIEKQLPTTHVEDDGHS